MNLRILVLIGQDINMKKKIKLLEEFLDTLNVEGLCGYWIDVSEELENPTVYIVIDLDWLQEVNTNPEFVANRMRNGIKNEIKKWIGLDVYVGSTAKKCSQK